VDADEENTSEEEVQEAGGNRQPTRRCPGCPVMRVVAAVILLACIGCSEPEHARIVIRIQGDQDARVIKVIETHAPISPRECQTATTLPFPSAVPSGCTAMECPGKYPPAVLIVSCPTEVWVEIYEVTNFYGRDHAFKPNIGITRFRLAEEFGREAVDFQYPYVPVGPGGTE
jgi:hypothetical protein